MYLADVGSISQDALAFMLPLKPSHRNSRLSPRSRKLNGSDDAVGGGGAVDGMAVGGSGGMFRASAQKPVLCESVEMTTRDCLERAPWRCHHGNDITWDTCKACGVQWSFIQIVIMKVTVIEGHHQGNVHEHESHH